MIYRQLGDSDIQVPAITFGAWAIGGWWWGASDDQEAIAAIQAGIDAGINCIDTAPMYGFGHSEEVVGQAIRGRRDQVIIATKCGLIWDHVQGEYFFEAEDERGQHPVYRCLTKPSILAECDRSLERLGVDVIDLYQCHWPDRTTPIEETMEALLELRDAGKIRAIGVSNFTEEMIEECLEYGPVHSNQPKFSLLSREHLDGVIRFAHSKGIASIVYSPLEQGLLTGKVTMDRKFAPGDYRAEQPWFRPVNRRRVLDVLEEVVQPIADAHNATLGQIAIAWTIHAPGITSALVGARNAKQVAENAAAADIQLTPEEQLSIFAAFDKLDEPE